VTDTTAHGVDQPNMAQRIWGAPVIDLLRVQFPWGTADASMASAASAIGDRIVPNKIRVHHPGADGQPSLTLDLEVVDGVPQCRSVSIVSVDGGREVRPLDLSAVKLSEWIADTFAAFAFERRGVAFERVSNVATPEEKDGPTRSAWAGVAQDIAAANEFQRARRGRGARSVTPQLLERASEIYKEHFAASPTKAVAAAFGVSERTASGWITRARSEEYGYLLPPTKRGQKKK